jgi:hypothetical protein
MSYPPSTYAITFTQAQGIQASAMLTCSWQSPPSPTNDNPEIAFTIYFGPGDCTQPGWTSSSGVVNELDDVSATDMSSGGQGEWVSLTAKSSGGSNIDLLGFVNWANYQSFVGPSASPDAAVVLVLSGNLVWPGGTALGANTGFNAIMYSGSISG